MVGLQTIGTNAWDGQEDGNEEEQVSCTYVLSEVSVFNKRLLSGWGEKRSETKNQAERREEQGRDKKRVEELGRERSD